MGEVIRLLHMGSVVQYLHDCLNISVQILCEIQLVGFCILVEFCPSNHVPNAKK